MSIAKAGAGRERAVARNVPVPGPAVQPAPANGVRTRPKPAGCAARRLLKPMRLFLPLSAAAAIAALFAWPGLDDRAPQIRPGIAQLADQEAGGNRLAKVRFTGIDRNRNPYGLAAEALIQRTADGDEVDLSKPEADFTTGDGAWVVVFSPRGRYARKPRTVVLEGGVSLYHDSGYALRTDGARVDLDRATAVSDSPVTGQGPAARLEAAGFRIPRDGQRIEFAGPARVVLYGDPGAAPQ